MWLAVPGDLATATGGYAYARRLIEALPATGWRPRLVSLPDGFPFPSPHNLETARRVLSAVPPGAPVIVDGLAYGAMPRALLDAVACRPIPLVHHVLAMETGLSEKAARRLRESEREALGAATLVIASSGHTADVLADSYGVPRENIRIAPPGVDDAPRATGAGEPPRLLSVGAVIPRKGFDTLVRALARLADLSWSCLIVGNLERDAATTEALRRLIARLNLDRQVTLTGELSDEGLASAYAQSDVFVLPSRYEGYGMAFAEALVRGLPIVACRGGAVPQTVPADAGLLVPVDDDLALSDALRRLLTNDTLRARMSDAAWQHGRSLPRWADNARAVASALEETTRNGPIR